MVHIHLVKEQSITGVDLLLFFCGGNMPLYMCHDLKTTSDHQDTGHELRS